MNWFLYNLLDPAVLAEARSLRLERDANAPGEMNVLGPCNHCGQPHIVVGVIKRDDDGAGMLSLELEPGQSAAELLLRLCALMLEQECAEQRRRLESNGHDSESDGAKLPAAVTLQ